MSRRPPRYHAPIVDVRVVLDPSGDHRLVVETDGGLMIADYDAGQIKQLEQAIEQFRSITIQADGGPDFHNRRTVPLGGFL
ncbi:MAG TPA: hypothetical protein VGN79_12215 [Devosia sp.]|jgi:hypothetical protein|nr:hypothetical protein [Devosia sp.]